MSWWPWKRRSKTNLRGRFHIIRAKFDSARTTPDNRRHWANADGLSADAAATSDVRRILRNRARYEVANNSYARGIVLTLANDVVGTGPRLQLLTEDAEANRTLEQEFDRWSKTVGLAEKLRTMRVARAQDGEAFALLTSNSQLAVPVKMDLRLVEADQVTTPNLVFDKPNAVDGIVFDESGNPVEYHVLKAHPGSKQAGLGMQYDRVSAESMVHWFRADRPGQSRGLPDILPALPLFAMLRQYSLAVLDSARAAANVAIVMKTNAPAGGEAAEVEPMATMEWERNMAIFGPEGWEPSQIRAEQPTTTFAEFHNHILNEIARCLNMPFNVAAGNSSGYNYASGRLDHQTYFKSIRVEQSHLEAVILDRVLDAWMGEAVRAFDLLPLRLVTHWPHQWFWDGHEHVDPAKEAKAQAMRLAGNTTTLAIEYAKLGLDWEEQLRQRAKEKELMRELGLTETEALPAAEKDDEDEPETNREAA